MTNKEIQEARTDYCAGRSCRNCIFYTCARDKFNTYCHELTTEQICDILSIIKEEESMTKKEEIQKEIDKTKKQLVKLYKALEEAKNEVPDVLPFNIGDELFTVSIDGKVDEFKFTDSKEWDGVMRESHRAFKSKNYAEEFAEKTQFVADLLHFKYLYDRDFKPDWEDSTKRKWYVCHNGYRYVCDSNYIAHNIPVVYFSSEEIAERCAKWLNKKYGYTKE